MSKPQKSSLPTHIAIIMDGNRRWARKQGLSVLRGHEYASNNAIEPLVVRCIELGIPYLTLWAFSTENWQRDRAEVEGLMKIFRSGLPRNGERLMKKGVKLNAIGELTKFPKDIQEGMDEWKERTKNNTAITVTFALNYGGRDEILRAVRKLVTDHQFTKPADITEKMFAQYLDTAGMPDPDFIIRPGGEQRLSGYLPWQAVYAEYYFTDVLMPDFTPAELDKALAEYQRRQRRFGT